MPSTRTTPEESGRYQQQPQTVSRTLGKTSLEINELALRARRSIAIAGPRCRGNLQSLAFHLRGLGCQGHPSTPRVRVCWYVPPRGPSRAQVNAADRGLRASTMAGFEPSGNLRDWQTAAPRIESIFAVELCQETLRPLAGGVKLQAVPATRARLEESESVPTTTADDLPHSGQNLPGNQRVSSESEEIDCDCWPQDAGQPPGPFTSAGSNSKNDSSGVNEAGCYSGLRKPFPKELNLRLIFTLRPDFSEVWVCASEGTKPRAS